MHKIQASKYDIGSDSRYYKTSFTFRLALDSLLRLFCTSILRFY